KSDAGINNTFSTVYGFGGVCAAAGGGCGRRFWTIRVVLRKELLKGVGLLKDVIDLFEFLRFVITVPAHSRRIGLINNITVNGFNFFYEVSVDLIATIGKGCVTLGNGKGRGALSAQSQRQVFW